MKVRAAPSAWLPVALGAMVVGCGGGPELKAEVQLQGCQEVGAYGTFVVGTMTVTNRGSADAHGYGPIDYYLGTRVVNARGEVVLDRPVPPSSPSLDNLPWDLAPGQEISTQTLRIWDMKIDSMPAPAGNYDITLILQDGTPSKEVCVELPSCAACRP